MSFPTLPVSPSLPLPQEAIDMTIRSQSDGGYVQTRRRTTRTLHSFGPIKYSVLLQSEKVAIEALDTTMGGWGIFSWTHPKDGTTHNVRFAENGRPKFELVSPVAWSCTFTLQEV
jgi:hypothetical protein